jgi:hypothetical protein
MLPDDEDEDDGHPDASSGHSALHVQQKIMRYVDNQRAAEARKSLTDLGDAPSLRRVDELQHADNEHMWLWPLSKHRGPVLPDVDFIEALRIRLGIAGPIDVVPCTLCGIIPIEGVGPHALCCAKAECTRGHTSVTKQLAEEIGAVDPTMEVEPAGLIPGTSLRPADILTGALGHGLVAIDIDIASPDAQGADENFLQVMLTRKVNKYEAHRSKLERQNIEYRSLPFSCYGRPHASTIATLRTLTQRIAWRRGCSAGEWRYRRLRSKIVTQIWARAARMVRSCWPDLECDDGDLADEDGPAKPT